MGDAAVAVLGFPDDKLATMLRVSELFRVARTGP